MIFIKNKTLSTFVLIVPNCFNDHFALECLFISLVRSRSEHASITWDSHSFSISNEIESAVRDKRLRFIGFKMKTVRPPYSGHRNSLNFLNLKSLVGSKKRFLCKLF